MTTQRIAGILLALAACGGPKDAGQNAPAKPQTAAEASEAGTQAAKEGAREGCLHGEGAHGAACGGATVPPPGAGGHFGAPFSLAESKPLASVLGEDPPRGPVRVRGTIDSVCRKKGCWMVLADGDRKARILMKDHAFSVPTDSRGKQAEVEGTVEVRELSKAQVEHIAEDEGADPSKAGGPRREFVITATAVEVVSKS